MGAGAEFFGSHAIGADDHHVTLDAPSRVERPDYDADYPPRSRREFDPAQRRSRDEEHLRVLTILYYVFGGLSFLGASIPIIHVVIGISLLVGNYGRPDAVTVGWSFIGVGGAIILLGYAFAACMIYVGFNLSWRKRYTFCFVMACLCCLQIVFFPFGLVGLLLGVFTVIVLARPCVRELFNCDLKAPPLGQEVIAGPRTPAPSIGDGAFLPEDRFQRLPQQPDARPKGDDGQEGGDYRRTFDPRPAAPVPDPLRSLSIFYFIGAIVLAVLGTLAIVLVVIGIWGLVTATNRHADEASGVIMTSLGGAYMLEGWLGALALFGVGRNLALRRQYWSCFILGCLFCLLLPMFGIPTIVLLTRPGVKAAFAPSRKGWPLSIF